MRVSVPRRGIAVEENLYFAEVVPGVSERKRFSYRGYLRRNTRVMALPQLTVSCLWSLGEMPNLREKADRKAASDR